MIYEYECAVCKKHVDHLLKMADRENPPPCDSCGGTLNHVITPPTVAIDGTDPDFPGAALKWEKDRIRAIAREQKTLKETGDYYANLRHV